MFQQDLGQHWASFSPDFRINKVVGHHLHGNGGAVDASEPEGGVNAVVANDVLVANGVVAANDGVVARYILVGVGVGVGVARDAVPNQRGILGQVDLSETPPGVGKMKIYCLN